MPPKRLYISSTLETNYNWQTLYNPKTGQKTCWSLINEILNKAKIPVIPPLLENDIFVLDFGSKAQLFNDYFVRQCITIDTGSKVPNQLVYNAPLLAQFQISEEKNEHNSFFEPK